VSFSERGQNRPTPTQNESTGSCESGSTRGGVISVSTDERESGERPAGVQTTQVAWIKAHKLLRPG
jgi:hypothetical protein